MIYTPKVFGTCNGAKRAIDLAYSLANEKKKVVIYKDILHNARVIQDLKEVGIECVSDIDNLDNDTSVIIRAHGEPESTYKFLESKNIKVFDATCPNVMKIHNIIKDRFEKGFSIIIIGKKNHPEVIGSNGWCDNNAFVVETKEDISAIKKLNQEALIICQTTISIEMFEELSSEILKSYDNCNFEIINTVCLAQKAIQNSSVLLAKKMDYTFVIGGEKSSNTKELYNACSKHCKSYMFSNLNDFFLFLKKEKNISRKTKICITGGASTPIYQIDEYKQLLEFYLSYTEMLSLFDNEINSINASLSNENDNEIICDAIAKFVSLNSGGKYIRAFLINLGYSIFGKKKNYGIDLALAYEIFQTSILIHDDVIDNATTRRGKKTIPVLYNEEFSSSENHSNNFVKTKSDVSNSLAICLGDLGYYFANRIIVKSYAKDKNLASVLDYYNNIVINTIKGEIIDVFLPFKEQYFSVNSKLDDILKISELKTSWYTIVGPFCLGMVLAGQDYENVKQMESVLMPLGVAFQIKDDLLGIFSDNTVVGKDSSDISEFKQTLLYFYTVNQEKYKDKLLKYYGKRNLSVKDVETVRKIFDESGAKQFAIDMMNKLFAESKVKLEKLEIDEKYKNILFGFISYLELRDK